MFAVESRRTSRIDAEACRDVAIPQRVVEPQHNRCAAHAA
jgi:hypothetical protein